MNKPRVLMIGPGRDVMGGVSAVVNNYYASGLDKMTQLRYLSTMEDGSKPKKLAVAVRAYFVFGRLLKDYDIIHIHMAAYASFDRKALFVKKAYRAGKKIIIHQHGGDFDRYLAQDVDEKQLRKIIDTFAMCDKLVVLSEEWAAFFSEHGLCDPKKIVVLHNGVIMPAYERTDYSDHRILMLGRLVEKKGAFDLIKAMPEVTRAIPDAVLYLAGDGEIERCRSMAAAGGIQEHIQFLGWIREKEKEAYLKKCSVFILPSYHEGMPISLLEAMSYSMASICTDVGGVPRVIKPDTNGILIKPGDIGAIAGALIGMLSDEEKKERIGRAGRDCVKDHFDFSKITQQLLLLYREMTA